MPTLKQLDDRYQFFSRRINMSLLVGNAGGLAAVFGFLGASDMAVSSEAAVETPAILFAVGMSVTAARDGLIFLSAWFEYAARLAPDGIVSRMQFGVSTKFVIIGLLPFASGALFFTGLAMGMNNILSLSGGAAGCGVCST